MKRLILPLILLFSFNLKSQNTNYSLLDSIYTQEIDNRDTITYLCKYSYQGNLVTNFESNVITKSNIGFTKFGENRFYDSNDRLSIVETYQDDKIYTRYQFEYMTPVPSYSLIAKSYIDSTDTYRNSMKYDYIYDESSRLIETFEHRWNNDTIGWEVDENTKHFYGNDSKVDSSISTRSLTSRQSAWDKNETYLEQITSYSIRLYSYSENIDSIFTYSNSHGTPFDGPPYDTILTRIESQTYSQDSIIYIDTKLSFGTDTNIYYTASNTPEAINKTIDFYPYRDTINLLPYKTPPSHSTYKSRFGYTTETKYFYKNNVISYLNKKEAFDLEIYPNPIRKGNIHLSESQNWKLYDAMGQLLNNGSGQEIDMNNYSIGTYILQTENGREIILKQ